MTTGQERVHNAALSGVEMKTLIRADFEALLANEGMLSDYIAYGRVGYKITLSLYIDNPHTPRSTSHLTSKPLATAAVIANPALGAVEAAPLRAPLTDESAIGATAISRNVSSPNAERLRNGLPIPVSVKQQDGTITTEMVKYPPDPDLGAGDVVIEDVTTQIKGE